MTVTDTGHDTEEAKVASGARTHSRHPSTSTISSLLPTDSMVTVRLSDSPVASVVGVCPQTDDHNTSSDSVVLEETRNPNSTCMGTTSDFHDHAIILEEDSLDAGKGLKNDMASIADEDSSIHTSNTIRSRSDTSGSFSSTGSAQVDWDELERSEEQAPRDEGSDEVCNTSITT